YGGHHEFGSAVHAAPRSVERRVKFDRYRVQVVSQFRRLRLRSESFHIALRKVLGEFVGRSLQFGSAYLICMRDIAEQLFPRLGWIVGSPVERLLVGGEEDVEWPSAVESHSLYRFHVDLVDVGTFFAIDFNANEMLIHHLCD